MKVRVLTGAGVSAESGIPTFRGKGGLWDRYRPEGLASPEAFRKDPKLVWEWYDWRRKAIANAKPNEGHRVLARMEELFGDFWLITQNVDGLHQRAGSRKVIELHGSIWEVLCIECGRSFYDSKVPFEEIPPRCKECGGLLRPGVVWFGEPLPQDAIDRAFELSSEADIFVVVGTSARVYPAAELPLIAKRYGAFLIEVNPESTPISPYADEVIRKKASTGLAEVLKLLRA